MQAQSITSRRPRPKRTPEQARQFDHFSVGNAAMAVGQLQESGACKGACVPYTDVFTYARWQDQGQQVRRGEHGAKLSVIITVEDDDGQTHRLPRVSTVFCRCQVDTKGQQA